MVYEPVELAQDFRSFDFMSPWEGAEYVLPGDEKAARERRRRRQWPSPRPPTSRGYRRGGKAAKKAAEKKPTARLHKADCQSWRRRARTDGKPSGQEAAQGQAPDTPEATKPARSRKKPTDGGAS